MRQSADYKIGKGWRELVKDGVADELFSTSLLESLKYIQTNGIKRFERKTKRRRRKGTSSKRV